ncbi:hypothetical protein GKIL_0868 [Gloeobacter kilaueensis JS1]|uniref:HTH cro/C1-type domain-containing protein n=1 Tax=Gloeobacter kilaueensis (strain ATCC BAA-2537 / CCAP 1431/1 / ULC 316 / JS1) TaxID=1183438 RepID=U5QHK0_GLOK1|nr:hypothetical protein GKIL_0868 [Gloeobacter kilaueensis JS1]
MPPVDGPFIKAELSRRNVELQDIAAAVGVSATIVSLVISGHRSSKRVAQAIAAAAGVPVEKVIALRKSKAQAPSTKVAPEPVTTTTRSTT